MTTFMSRSTSLLLFIGILVGIFAGCGHEAPVSSSEFAPESSIDAPISDAIQSSEEGSEVPESIGQPGGTLTVIFPKIGAADAALLMTEDSTVLIDTGESNDGDEILVLLEAYDRTSIDLLIISHYDKDHIGGAAEVISSIPVARLIGSTSRKGSEAMDAYLDALNAAGLSEETPDAQISITLGSLVITVNPPGKVQYVEDQSNNSSNLVEVRFGDTVMLFAGDAMADRLSEEDWNDGQYDLIKIPHHGRDPETLDFYLSAFRESAAAVITSSKNDPEDDDLKDSLKAAGINVYLTRKGMITAVTDGTSLDIIQK